MKRISKPIRKADWSRIVRMKADTVRGDDQDGETRVVYRPALRALENYTLSTVCPRCNQPVLRRACKVICEHCGFQWDCSEL